MDGLWVVVADEAVARILELPRPGGELQEVQTLTDPAAQAQRADLRRDAEGRRAGNVTTSAGQDEAQREAESFATIVATRLADARRAGRYERLRIVAAPRFLGLLRKALPREVAECVVDDEDKDLVQLDRRSLTERLFPGTPR